MEGSAVNWMVMEDEEDQPVVLTDAEKQERYRLQRKAHREEIGQSHEAGRTISVGTSR